MPNDMKVWHPAPELDHCKDRGECTIPGRGFCMIHKTPLGTQMRCEAGMIPNACPKLSKDQAEIEL